ncbi:MAG TPA: GNAT family N-acetyltransferase [Pirellulales bacterium]|nr:GNAT family N-acetyltransferase [Pirellulales bacterium]
MISFRAFLNGDTPRIVEIWRSQAPERGLVQPLTVDLFESHVLAKLYFDRQGLVLALDDEMPIGFGHASFGPTNNGADVSTDWGVVSLVMVRANYQRQGIGAELVRRCEAYLAGRGARVMYAGGIRPMNGFYLGLYGGSELPGVLCSAARAQQLFRSTGYREIDRTLVFHRDLLSFRPPIDRQQIQIRRRCTLKLINDPPAQSWWDACVFGPLDRTRFELRANQGNALLASAAIWSMQPLASSWGVRAAGLIDVDVPEEHRRQGMATHLLAEIFRQLAASGITMVEVQTMQANTPARELYKKLGFQQIDQGSVFRKE